MSTLDSIFNRPDTAIDPVCKMTVDMTNPPGGVAEHQGETYYFCSSGCRQAFETDPAKYLDPSNMGGHHEGHGHEGHHH